MDFPLKLAMQDRVRNFIELQTAPRPVAAFAKSYPAGYEGYLHTHSRAQLLYAESGSMRLTTAQGCWIIPTGRAVWIPAEYPHQTGSLGPLEMRTLYLAPHSVGAQAPLLPRMLRVSRLLHELVLRVMQIPVEYDEQGQEGLLIRALLGEIDWSPVHPVSLPLVQDKRLRRIEKTLLRHPSHAQTMDGWARLLKISPRTLTRLLKQETDLSFQRWCDQIRAYLAIQMLMEQTPLVQIADALGYSTAWAFTAMFKRVTGKLPSRYLDTD